MKKVTQNFIISLAMATVILVLTLVLGIFLSVYGDGLECMGEDISTIFEDGEVDTVEGHGAIFESSILFVGAFMGAVVLALVILMGGYAFLLILFAVVARAVFAPRGGRLLIYRILMGIEYVLQAGIVFFLITILLEETGLSFIIVLAITAAVVAGLVYSAVNTYSKKICA